ncbi:hypothetical protein ACH4GE_33265 [Streptomyces tendae]|uniref:hypothetical protein n=1 Tax=Streptomyces tendae TaxID=1932 RepID=UPI001E60D643|nr:hypothetical protein [Streptomyces tendae]
MLLFIAATYQVTDGAGRQWEARKMINKVRPEQWMRRATGHGTKGTREYDCAKGFTGLDQGQVTCWNSWMRWSLFSLIAAAVLALTATAVHETAEERPDGSPASW